MAIKLDGKTRPEKYSIVITRFWERKTTFVSHKHNTLMLRTKPLDNNPED